MEAKELRIGNYVGFIKHQHTTIIESMWEDLIGHSSGSERGIDDFEPIPLTEEWLLKFGFKEYDKRKNRFITDDGFEIEIQGKNYAYCIYDVESAPHLTHFIGHCKYVHQLQNLYFALTNEELTIK